MIVSELGTYLNTVGSASSSELARRFHTTEDAIEAMLGIWMRKGRVKKIQTGLCSGTCCGMRTQTRYEWVQDSNQIAVLS